MQTVKELPLVGWREWVRLPEFGGVSVKAKIDTGARTSAIHAGNIVETWSEEQMFVQFDLSPGHTGPHARSVTVPCRARVIDRRIIRNSGGQEQARYVILTPAVIGEYEFPIELSLTRRDKMGFRMLIGREAIKNRFWVDPAQSFVQDG